MSNLGGTTLFILVVIVELTLMISGMALVPIIASSKNKSKYAHAIQPSFVVMGFIIFIAYMIF